MDNGTNSTVFNNTIHPSFQEHHLSIFDDWNMNIRRDSTAAALYLNIETKDGICIQSTNRAILEHNTFSMNIGLNSIIAALVYDEGNQE